MRIKEFVPPMGIRCLHFPHKFSSIDRKSMQEWADFWFDSAKEMYTQESRVEPAIFLLTGKETHVLQIEPFMVDKATKSLIKPTVRNLINEMRRKGITVYASLFISEAYSLRGPVEEIDINTPVKDQKGAKECIHAILETINTTKLKQIFLVDQQFGEEEDWTHLPIGEGMLTGFLDKEGIIYA